MIIARDRDGPIGRVIGNGHCVAHVQAVSDVGHTSLWRRGARVWPDGVPRGAIIATFDPDGTYGNHTDGRSHAAVALTVHSGGIDVLDQWVGRPVGPRTIRNNNGQGPWVNDASRYYVVTYESASSADRLGSVMARLENVTRRLETAVIRRT